MKDLIIITSIVQVLVLFSNYFWLIILTVSDAIICQISKEFYAGAWPRVLDVVGEYFAAVVFRSSARSWWEEAEENGTKSQAATDCSMII